MIAHQHQQLMQKTYEAAPGCSSTRLRATGEVSSQADLAAAHVPKVHLAQRVEPVQGPGARPACYNSQVLLQCMPRGLKALWLWCDDTCSTCSTTSAIGCRCLAADMQHPNSISQQHCCRLALQQPGKATQRSGSGHGCLN